MLDILTAAPVSIKFGDRTFRVGALKLRELGLLQRFVREHVPKPTVAVKEILPLYPPEEHRELLKQAVFDERDWPPSVGTAEGNKPLLTTEDGQRCLVSVVLRKYQPDLSDADIDDIMGGLSEEDFYVLYSIAFGEDGSDPEAVRAASRDRLAALQAAMLAGTAVAPTEDQTTANSSTN